MYYASFRPLPVARDETLTIIASEELPNLKGKVLLWADAALVSHSVLADLYRTLPNLKAAHFSHGGKTLDSLLIYSDGEREPEEADHIVIVGGGSSLNKGLYLADAFKQRGTKITLVPTTTLAIADVAVGSKGIVDALPDELPPELDRTVPQKNYYRKYVNPDFIYLNPAFIETLPLKEKIAGLSECLKHGLMQSEELMEEVLNLYNHPSPPGLEIYRCALKTMKLKAQVLEIDPFEHGYGQILSYGHLHAHSLEKAQFLKVPHSRSVLWGCLLDLVLAGPHDILNRMTACYPFLQPHDLVFHDELFLTRLEKAYLSDHKKFNFDSLGNFRCIALNSVGQYAEESQLLYLSFHFADVIDAWKRTLKTVQN